METDTLIGTIMPRNNFGWYFRPSTRMYEIWWMGDMPVISLSAEVLPFMPNELVDQDGSLPQGSQGSS